jgi:hypothetical protein
VRCSGKLSDGDSVLVVAYVLEYGPFEPTRTQITSPCLVSLGSRPM